MKLLIFLLSFIIIFCTYSQSQPDSVERLIEKMRLEHKQKVEKMFNQFFNDDFFRDDPDPFAEMRRMRDMMMKRLNSPSTQFDQLFEQRFGGGSIDDISRVEDDQSITFKIKIKNIKDKKIDIKVGNGMIAISGKIETEGQQKMQSSFNRSFTIPAGVDEKKAEISIDKDTISIKLPKTKKNKIPIQNEGRVI